MLSDEQIERYSRHIILPQMGVRGQERLLAAAVAVVGDTVSGATANLYLAAAGVGQLTITQDDDALQDLTTLNPDCHITRVPVEIGREDAAALVHTHAVVIDASGSDATSMMLNRACVELRKPLVWGRAGARAGEVTVFAPRRQHSPCYACLKRDPLAREGTHLAAVTDRFVGTLQATEAIKIVAEIGETLTGRLAIYDVLDSAVREVEVTRDSSCLVCRPADHAEGVVE